MIENSTSLPAGAGAETGDGASESGFQSQSTVTIIRPPVNQSGSDRVVTHDHSESGARQDHFTESRDLILVEERSGPSRATVVGAALAGAIVGGAIPFMLSGRSSSAGSRSSDKQQRAVITESVIVNRSPRELYDFWRNFTNLPQFMDNIKSVETLDERRSHWVIKAPAGTSIEFDSRVTDDVPGRIISWQSEEGASVPNSGRVEFIETASGNATNVQVTLSYDPPAGTAGRAIAKLFQREPSVQAREDLQRLKRLMEEGISASTK